MPLQLLWKGGTAGRALNQNLTGSALPYNPEPPAKDPPTPEATSERLTDRAYREAPVRARKLPADLAEEIGFRTRRGLPQLDTFMLARAAHLMSKRNGAPRHLEYENGLSAYCEGEEFIKSIQGFAEDTWRRLYKRPIPDGDPLEDERFHRFYRRVQKGFHRRLSDYLEDRGPAVESPNKLERDSGGKRWAIRGDWNAGQRESEPLDLVFGGIEPGPPDTREPVDVGAHLERLVSYEEQLHREFDVTETHSRHDGPRRRAKFLPFMRRHNNGEESPRHLRIGSWHREQVAVRDAYVRVPWIIAEIDGEDRDESLELARRLVEKLEERGADPGDLLCSYSGNRSIHVRVPDGLLGNPIYRNTRIATERIRRFWESVCGKNTELFEAIDSSCFSPLHSIRSIGSIHEEYDGSFQSPQVRYCVGFSGQDLLRYGRDYLFGLATGPDYSNPERRRGGTYYSPCTIPDPATFMPKSELADLLRTGRTNSPARTNCETRGSRGIIDRLEHGVREGENWGEEIGYRGVGRNRAAFIYALNLWTGRSPPDPRRKLREWNEKNVPALSEEELRTCLESARRVARTRVIGSDF